ncbi:MAG: flagellar biosynthesis protein FlhB [Phycisphaerales bacterium]|nr:flagellar biosynthesis protein FlhB [Phycisphaerales bacterium]
MAEEMGERTEQPTARRLSEARGRGQVAKSQDLASALDLVGGVLLIVFFGGSAITVLAAIMRRVLGDGAGNPVDPASIRALLISTGLQAGWIIGPGLAMMLLVGVLAHGGQVGWLFTTEPLSPKFTRLNPVAGLKRLLSTRNLVKAALNVWKLALTGLIAALVIRHQLDELAALPRLAMAPALYLLALKALELVLWLLPLLVLIGVIDWMYQRWQHTRDLRMTRQEVKDERRSSEGDPEVKRRRFRMAYEIAMQRINQSVPQADVIVTNPTHYSVALRYDQATMRAPKVVAKGADHMAFRIRHVAVRSGVPIVERPPLARAIYHNVEVGQEVSPDLYEAVAEVLAYVYRIAGRAA